MMDRRSRLVRSLLIGFLVAVSCSTSAPQANPPASRPVADYGTWLWDGSSWTHLSSDSFGDGSSPAPLHYWHGVGGLIGLVQPGFLGGPQWGPVEKWNGSGWEMDPQFPPARPALADSGFSLSEPQASLVYDDANGVLAYMDPMKRSVWDWLGGSWVQVVTYDQWPAGLGFYDAAYDPAIKQVLLVGNGTWTWNGRAFSELSSQSPRVLGRVQLSPDGKGSMVAFAAGYVNFGATEFDGQQWTDLSKPNPCHPQPVPEIVVMRLVLDAANGELIGIGEDANWGVHMVRWTGGTWEVVSAEVTPPPGDIQVTYDPELAGVVLTVEPRDLKTHLINNPLDLCLTA